ncbi:hypothetical protein GF338_02250 [candidate division WOR-3 bacterium]|nr:hypothetical protein [candidate division WOR-3 bacterium]
MDKRCKCLLILGVLILSTITCTHDGTTTIEVDLDTTYFPIKEGYAWIYERHTHEGHTGYEEDYYDTFTISVYGDTKSLEGGEFLDIGSHAEIQNGEIKVWTTTIPLNPTSIDSFEDDKYKIEITPSGEDLRLFAIDKDPFYWPADYEVRRKKGIGAMW